MNRNQKIALGCGGAGCLGLIVVVIAGGLIWYFATSSNTNRSFNMNRSTNRNSSTNSTNENSDTNANSNANDAADTETSTNLDDDAKHRLFQAATFTQDTALINRVLKKIGFMNASGNPNPGYEQFARDHFAWALKNTDFIQSVSTPEAARAYVNEHLDD